MSNQQIYKCREGWLKSKIIKQATGRQFSRSEVEARAGIEPANRGFAVPGLTTWLPRRAPKPLLSIDFAPLEQAKSPFAPLSYYEN